MSIPILESGRLTLRGHRADDFAACAAMWADPVVTRFFGRPFSAEETWSKLLRYAGMWPLLGFGYWAIEEKATRRFVGELGFADFQRDMTPPLDAPELGWVLAADVHGQGYATEAVRAALAWSDARFARSLCIIRPDNLASIRVAQKCGFRELRRGTYRDSPIAIFARERSGLM